MNLYPHSSHKVSQVISSSDPKNRTPKGVTFPQSFSGVNQIYRSFLASSSFSGFLCQKDNFISAISQTPFSPLYRKNHHRLSNPIVRRTGSTRSTWSNSWYNDGGTPGILPQARRRRRAHAQYPKQIPFLKSTRTLLLLFSEQLPVLCTPSFLTPI